MKQFSQHCLSKTITVHYDTSKYRSETDNIYKKAIAVVELKKGRASDAVVGQVQCYMGYVKEMLAEESQTVRGIIVAFEDDPRIQRALVVANNIDFYTYQIHFELKKL